MFITGLGVAAPPNRYSQLECLEAFRASRQFKLLTPRSRSLLQKVLTGKSGIRTRHLAVDKLEDAFNISPDILHERFSQHAPALTTIAAQSALRDANLDAERIDAVVISTCTGYLCPGLTSYVSEQLGLRSDVFALDLVGQGCGAALPNLRAAEGLLHSGKYKNILCASVEICSAAFYLDDDPGVLISACLFGDGAAAAIVSAKPLSGKRRVEWINADSRLVPAARDLLRFEMKNGMLRNILAPSVPTVAANHAKTVFDTVTSRAKISPKQISGWIFHAGGRDVLNALQETFALDETEISASAKILENYGNLSSPFVLFVLKETLDANAPGGLWWMCSFGAGFSCHGALLEVSNL